MRTGRVFTSIVCMGAILLAPMMPVMAQNTVAPASDSTPPDKPPLKPEELQQLLAPIALYPDTLLTQMLMASTYPLEIVQADRWAKDHKSLTGDALARELEKQTWDASVKSLVNFPDVLSVMGDKLDLTIKIGDAFIAQQADVLNTVQTLRAQAQAAGNLKSNEQLKIAVAPAPAAAPQTVVVQVAPPPQVITIASASPTVIYVPTYNPVVVYGTWAYPAYVPYPYYPPRPPGYVATAAISFGVGVACGVAWGYAWGHCNWGHNNININVNQNVNFNKNINRNINNVNINNTNINRNNTNINGGGTWQHNPAHRQGVAYPSQKTAQQFGGANQSAQATQARAAFRGRTDTGFNTPNAGGLNRPSPSPMPAQPNRSNPSPVPSTPNRFQPSPTPSVPSRSSPTVQNRGGAFDSAGGSGSAAHSASQRGQASRGTSGAAGAARAGRK